MYKTLKKLYEGMHKNNIKKVTIITKILIIVIIKIPTIIKVIMIIIKINVTNNS